MKIKTQSERHTLLTLSMVCMTQSLTRIEMKPIINLQPITNKDGIMGEGFYYMECRRKNQMGEYECWDCNEMFWADEPPEDKDICEDCQVWFQLDEGGYNG